MDEVEISQSLEKFGANWFYSWVNLCCVLVESSVNGETFLSLGSVAVLWDYKALHTQLNNSIQHLVSRVFFFNCILACPSLYYVNMELLLSGAYF